MKKIKARCKTLIVGVMTDVCVKQYKGKYPLMSQEQRIELIKSISYVDKAIFQNEFDYGFFVMMNKEYWGKDFLIFDSYEHKRKGADYLIKRTKGISSTLIKKNYAGANNSKY